MSEMENSIFNGEWDLSNVADGGEDKLLGILIGHWDSFVALLDDFGIWPLNECQYPEYLCDNNRALVEEALLEIAFAKGCRDIRTVLEEHAVSKGVRKAIIRAGMIAPFGAKNCKVQYVIETSDALSENEWEVILTGSKKEYIQTLINTAMTEPERVSLDTLIAEARESALISQILQKYLLENDSWQCSDPYELLALFHAIAHHNANAPRDDLMSTIIRAIYKTPPPDNLSDKRN